jgi:hypothetical protein
MPAAPAFAAGEIVATAIDGLRVRQRPSLSSSVLAGLLPLGAELEVAMGPIVVDDNAWYLVRDAGPEPAFEEGWIASGFAPEPYLMAAGRTNPDSPFVASFAQTGNAQYGPIEISDADHAIRWIALDPERVRCQLSVLLANPDSPFVASYAQTGNAQYGPIEITDADHAIRWIALDPERVRCQLSVLLGNSDATPVPVIRATVGNGVDPGMLQPGSFAAFGVRGQVFVTIESDCSWALVIERLPAATPVPSPSPTPSV